MNLEITCKKATEYIIQREEGKLSLTKRILLWKHMGICGLCKLFSKQSKFISGNSAHLHDHIEDSLSRPEKEKIIEVLQQQ